MAKIVNVQEVSIESIIPYENNAKIHGEEQIEKLKDSILEFGFLTPCLIDENKNLIAGHGRVMAAKELGFDTVPCVYIEGLTEEQRRAYILADNRLSELGEWDMELVNVELSELDRLGFDVSLTGFDFNVDLESDTFDDNIYTGVVDIPQYEPSEEDVTLSECYDMTKYSELVEEIEHSDIPDADKDFLKMAATRHIVFSYKRIADYYAKASENVQKLMEHSALVIIDVDDAIKWGYARLSSYLDEIEERERGEE